MEKFILFDVGANWGSDSLEVTKLNPNCETWAFEPTPELYQNLVWASTSGSVYPSSRLVDQHHRWPLTPMTDPDGIDYSDRYHAFKIALSDYDGEADFNLGQRSDCDWGSSSLLEFVDTRDTVWAGRDDLTFIDKTTVTVKRFDTWYKENNLDLPYISHFHVDTQGTDLNVLKGMGNLVTLIRTGVIECSTNEYTRLYKQGHTVSEAVDWLTAVGFHVGYVDYKENECNVYFSMN
jgi:hypothetical protein